VQRLVAQYGNYQPFGHAGEDIACPIGTPVRAIADGTVVWADWGTNLPGDDSDWGYRQRWYLYKSFPGIVTVIQHAGWLSVYGHLSSNDAAPRGTRVREGQVVALSGNTGGVAPHLHVAAIVDTSYRTGGGLIYGCTDPSKFYGSSTIELQPQAETITPKEWDEMASEAQVEAAAKRAASAAIREALSDPAVLDGIALAVLKRPCYLVDPATGAINGTTTLATKINWAAYLDRNSEGRELEALDLLRGLSEKFDIAHPAPAPDVEPAAATDPQLNVDPAPDAITPQVPAAVEAQAS
jgi:murein DD-endopeptidase MepM/ murein hydrolase activator NlpD